MKQWRLEIFLNEKGPATNTGRDQDDPREGSSYTQHYGGGSYLYFYFYFVWAQSLSHSPSVSPQSILFCRASSSLFAKPSINTVCFLVDCGDKKEERLRPEADNRKQSHVCSRSGSARRT